MKVVNVQEEIEPAQKEILVVDVIKKQLIRLLFIYLLISNVFIFIRIILRAFGADPNNLFAGFIFLVSGFFLLPFFGIFPQSEEEIVAGNPTADTSALIAVFCSNILIFLAMGVIYILTRMVKTRKQEKETLKKSKPVDTTITKVAVD